MPQATGGQLVTVDGHESVDRYCFRADAPNFLGVAYPEHVDPSTGLIRLESIGLDDLKKRGFSVQIASMLTLGQALADEGRRQAKKPGKGLRLEGIVRANVGAIHGIVDGGGGQVFHVRPKPIPTSAAHSEIWSAPDIQRSMLIKHRIALHALFGQMRPVRTIPRGRGAQWLKSLLLQSTRRANGWIFRILPG